jgi:hypothetical protein
MRCIMRCISHAMLHAAAVRLVSRPTRESSKHTPRRTRGLSRTATSASKHRCAAMQRASSVARCFGVAGQ